MRRGMLCSGIEVKPPGKAVPGDVQLQVQDVLGSLPDLWDACAGRPWTDTELPPGAR
jgi:hypothetical protein